MGTVIEIISLILLLDICRRVHAARATFFHAQAYHAWMTCAVVCVLVLVFEIPTAYMRDNGMNGELLAAFNAFATGTRIAAVTSFWAAIAISIPGSLGRTVLEATRWGVRSETSPKPQEPADHPQDDPRLRRVE